MQLTINSLKECFDRSRVGNSFNKSSDNFLYEIKTILKEQFSIRGIFPSLEITLAEDKEKQAYFNVQSSPFQTTPVLFKYIRIKSIGGKIFLDQLDPDVKFAIPVYFACETYELETADFKLFTLNGSIDPDIGAVHDVNVINRGMFPRRTLREE